MKFDIEEALEVLARTPNVLASMLKGIPDSWSSGNEGEGTWTPYDVIGHLIHGEKTDWIPRMEIILSDRADNTLVRFDRFAQFNESKGKSLQELLHEFASLRKSNLEKLRAKGLDTETLAKEGIHPALGRVTLEQLLATWVVHDLDHITQIARAMAHQYDAAVGPWKEYLGILNVKRK